MATTHPSTPTARHRVLKFGDIDQPLDALIERVVSDFGVTSWDCTDPDVVLAVAGHMGVTRVVHAAAVRAGRAGVVAVIPMSDQRMRAAAFVAGAAAVHALDQPVHRLCDVLAGVVRLKPRMLSTYRHR